MDVLKIHLNYLSPVEQEPIFGADVSIDGLDVDMSVKKDGYELITDYEIDGEGFYIFKGALLPEDCSNCGPGIEIQIRDVEIDPASIGEINADDIQNTYPLGQFLSFGEVNLSLDNYSDFDYYSWQYFTDSFYVEEEPEIIIQQIPGSLYLLETGTFDCNSLTSLLIDSEVRYLSIEAEQSDSMVYLTAIGQNQSEQVYWCINGEEMGPSDYIIIPDPPLELEICISTFPLDFCEPGFGLFGMSSCYSSVRNPGTYFNFCVPEISAQIQNFAQSYARVVLTDSNGDIYDSEYFSPIDEYELNLSNLEDYTDPEGEQVVKFITNISLPLYSQWGEMINLQVDSLNFAIGHP